MSGQWGSSGGGADSGILRNKIRGVVGEGKPEQLLVFGYACKIFRDDERALHIDQGKHLIPWMGDETLRIDRYDGRGTLSDLKQYEASKEGYDTIRWLDLNDSERKLEELCDAERYYSLEINEEEEEMYKEELAKRKLTNAFQYSYNENGTVTPPTLSVAELEPDGIPTVPEFNEDEQPYVPSPLLDVPVDISIPTTVKEYARIEKTALFVCRQGQQMEILIKTKQSENVQFNFLTQSDPLYKFYRHVLAAFKNGRYLPQYHKKNEPEKNEPPKDELSDNHYLHPSLVSSKPPVQTQVLPPPQILQATPVLTYQPSADCSYSQLVTRIQGTTPASANSAVITKQQEQAPVDQSILVPPQLTLEQQQYYHYYYLQQYYDYYRQLVQGGENGAQYAHMPHNFHQLDPNMQNFVHQLAFGQYVRHCQQQSAAEQIVATTQPSNNAYAQIVSNLNKDGTNPYLANVPQVPVTLVDSKPQAAEKYGQSQPDKSEIKVVVAEIKKPLLSLAAAYGSGSDTEDEENEGETSEADRKKSDLKSPEESSKTESESEEIDDKEELAKTIRDKKEISIPTAETQVIIDKMADYVFKNGEQFEDIIRAKNDSRFDFLKSDHKYHEYYRKKLRNLKGEPEAEVKHVPDKQKQKTKKKKEEKDKEENKKLKPKKVVAPVSFSIKKPKEEPPKDIKSALPIEESSDEETEDDKKAKEQQSELAKELTHSQAKLPGVIYNIQDQPGLQKLSHILETSVSAKSSSNSFNGKMFSKIANSQKEDIEKKKDKSDIIDVDGECAEHKEKRAEYKLKDKLAAVAREKLASVTREKALQLERKRKAAAFLKLKAQKESSSGGKVATPDPLALSALLLTNVKQNKHNRATDNKKNSEGNEPIFDDLPMKLKKKSKSKENKRTKSQSVSPQSLTPIRDEEIQERLESKLDTSTSTITEIVKSSSDGESSSGDCEIVEVSFPKTRRSRSRESGRSKEKKKHKEKKRKRSRSRSPEDTDRSRRKKEKKKKSHKRKHSKTSHDSKHKKKSKKRHRTRSKSRSSESSSSV